MEETAEKIVEKVRKTNPNLLYKCLKYLKKVEQSSDMDDYLHHLNILFIEWILEYMVLKPIIILTCLSATGFYTILQVNIVGRFLIAEGLSFLWYIIVQFRKDWREQNG